MYCTDELSSSIYNTLFLSILSPNVPTLVYYSHFVAFIVTFVMVAFIFFRKDKTLDLNLLMLILTSFSLLTILDVLLWTQVNSSLIMFFWSFWIPLFTVIFILSAYFLYVFLTQKDIHLSWKVLIGLVSLTVFYLSSTRLNLDYFSIPDCNIIEGTNFINTVFISSFVLLFIMSVFSILKIRKIEDKEVKKASILVSIGIIGFLVFFAGSSYWSSIANIFGSAPDIFKFEQYSYFGMTLFIALVTRVFVKYNIFHLQILATSALVSSIVILVFSQFFFIESQTAFILNIITFLLSVVFSVYLIKSVKREIEQKKSIEKINKQLENLVHFISHEVKGALGKSRLTYQAILEGEYGAATPEMKELVTMADSDTKRAVDMVMNILNSSDFKSGKIGTTKAPFDFKGSLLEAVADLSGDAKAKGLTIETTTADVDASGAPIDYTVNGDREQITKHVMKNIIDNSIKYTLTGGLKITLEKRGPNQSAMVKSPFGTVLLTIKDTGVGITPEDMRKLFTEGGKGAHSTDVNVHSTGYGLYFTKQIVEAHGGKVWAESAGAGKGSQFYMEMPVR